MTSAPSSDGFRFGSFELQLKERRLLAGGSPVRIGPHAFDVLVALVQHSGHLVSKDELFSRVWPRVVVEENTLQAHVSALRKILGPDAIATVSGRGYRFTPEVTSDEAAAREPSALPQNNLPQQLTSFIGRESQLSELKALLGTTRLLTLTGAGGCGKTRLAMQLAADLTQTQLDGLWLVEFAPLTDAGLVPHTVARVLGVREQPGIPLTQSLVEHLASRRTLLLLDNAEHLIQACAVLADTLLRKCDRLVVLLTSRERLGVAGELTYRVPSLSVPDPARDATPERVVAHESARLFVDRAKSHQPNFVLTAQNATALASICQRLDGIPLAIELAASRIRSMTVEEVNDRLDHRFGLLIGGSRTALARHRTLRSLIDWSYDLLSDAEKTMLNRVSVFAGGSTLAAAEHVCVAEGIVPHDVLDLLGSLVDKNLLVATDCNGATRYGLLETVRHYALERLRESGEEDIVRSRHLGYFKDRSFELCRHQSDVRREEKIRRLEQDHDNLRAALAWTEADKTRAERGVLLAADLFYFWYRRGHLEEGRTWIERLLSSTPVNDQGISHASGLETAGILGVAQGDLVGAERFLKQSLTLFTNLGERSRLAGPLGNLAHLAYERCEYSASLEYSEHALAMAREFNDYPQIRANLLTQTSIALEEGDLVLAETHVEEALALSRKLGRPSTATVLIHLGRLRFAQGNCNEAMVALTEALAIHREAQDLGQVAEALQWLGIVSNSGGDIASANSQLREALAIEHSLGSRVTGAQVLDLIAGLSLEFTSPLVAARIWGHVESLRAQTAARARPSLRVRTERGIAAARGALQDDAAFDLAWSAGRAMSFDEASRYALGIVNDTNSKA